MQGSVSQIVYLCPSLNCLNVENLLRKKDLNLPVFYHKIKPCPKI